MNWIIWIIIACEIGFWVLIILGLTARYLLNRKKLGLVLLALTPLVDLLLLAVSAIDLYHGAKANIGHGLAAVYIGVSVGFGKNMIRWADRQFRIRVLKTGEKEKDLFGLEFAKANLIGWLRHLLAYCIGGSLIAATVLFVGDFERTSELVGIMRVWTIVLAIDLIITLSYFVWPKKEKGRI